MEINQLKYSNKEASNLLDKILLGDKHLNREYFNGLNASEKNYFIKIFTELKESGVSETLNTIWEVDYEQKPVSIDEFLNDEYYLGQVYGPRLYKGWKPHLDNIFNLKTILEVCLTGDTKVPLMSGEVKTMRELAKLKYPFFVQSLDKDTLEPKVGLAHSTKLTRKNQPVYKVTLDNGKCVRGTSDHPLMKRDGTKIFIKSLKVGDSLYPYNSKLSDSSDDLNRIGYHQVYSPITGEWVWSHYLADKYNLDNSFYESTRGSVRHHKDFNKRNNDPSNIIRLEWFEHLKIHWKGGGTFIRLWKEKWFRDLMAEVSSKNLTKRWANDKEGLIRAIQEGKQEWYKSKECKELAKSNLSVFNNALRSNEKWALNILKSNCNKGRNLLWNSVEYKNSRLSHKKSLSKWMLESGQGKVMSDIVWKGENSEKNRIEFSKRMVEFNRNHPNRRDDITLEKINTQIENGLVTYLDLAKYFNCSENKIKTLVSATYIKNYNHKVVSIEFDGYEDVYNFTVEDDHIYALDCGIYSFNCLTGSIGIGKSNIAAVILLYDLYKLLCLRSPQSYYGLTPTTKIVLAIFNITLDLVGAVGLQIWTDNIASSPFFQEIIDFNPRSPEAIKFPKNIDIVVGSRFKHSLGSAVFCFTGDTKISLLNGTEVRMDELVPGNKYWIYSSDKHGSMVPKLATALGITKYVKELQVVILDNGAIERCTPDHPWRMRDGTYRRADELAEGDSLMPLDKRLTHKVLASFTIQLREPIPVYDISVPDTHNFALSSGVIVHNSAFLDEANFGIGSEDVGKKGGNVGQVYETYLSLLRRMESRFLEHGGKIPGHMILVSSKKSKNDFLERHIKKNRSKPTTYVVDEPIYKIRTHKYDDSSEKYIPLYSGETFRVMVGDQRKDSKILEPGELVSPGYRVEQIPIEYFSSFEKDIENSLRDISGISLYSESSFVLNRDLFRRSINYKRFNPFTKDYVELTFQGSDKLSDYLENWFKSYINKVSVPRAIHIDIGVTGDALGIAMSHISGKKLVSRMNIDLEYSDTMEYTYKTDFLLRVKYEDGDSLPLFKISQFIVELRDVYGVDIGWISADGYQSTYLLQLMRAKGFNTSIISLDRNPDGYQTLKNAHYEGRIDVPVYEIYVVEMLSLIQDNITYKVDHQDTNIDGSNGSKDVSDSEAGTIHSLTINKIFSDYANSPSSGDLEKIMDSMEESRKLQNIENIKSVTDIMNEDEFKDRDSGDIPDIDSIEDESDYY
jgi:hypothetical protein